MSLECYCVRMVVVFVRVSAMLYTYETIEISLKFHCFFNGRYVCDYIPHVYTYKTIANSLKFHCLFNGGAVCHCISHSIYMRNH